MPSGRKVPGLEPKVQMSQVLNRAIIAFLSILFWAVFVTAQTTEPARDLKGKYLAVEVEKFEVAKDVDIPDNQINVLMLEIVDELFKIKKFDQVIKPSSKPTVPQPA